MQRVLEPELMDEDDQARAYSEADFEDAHNACADRFAHWFRAQTVAPVGRVPRVLDLGCGPADVTVRVAKRLPDVAIHGLDGSAAMLRYGAMRVANAGLGDRVTLTRALLPQDPPPTPVDVVFCNSLLHHLHDPQALWGYISTYAATARIFVADLMRPSCMADVDALIRTHAAGAPEVLQRDFHASLCAAFTLDEVRGQLRAAGLKLEVVAVSDRHLVACTA